VKEQLTIVTRKGQITVPVEIRRALDLKIGDKVAISVEDGETEAHLRPVRSVAEMTFGSVSTTNEVKDTVSLRELAMEDIAENAMQEGLADDAPEG
jgi:AbrB family looped-hinge helix DNA binding protein